MIIYPAIDIKGGKCVRLEQGDFNRLTEFNDDVVAQAKEFEAAGFEWLHVVDLDGAKKGRPINTALVEKIAANTSLKVQVGGGIRDYQAVEKLLSFGVSRVILGTVAINNFELLEKLCVDFPGKIAVGIDAIGNKVATHGWQEESGVFVFDLVEKLEKIGVCAIIYTDISKDGLLSGFDQSGTQEIAKNISIPIIASGGVTSVDDIKALVAMKEYGVNGAIVGRAFYDRKLSYADALMAASQ